MTQQESQQNLYAFAEMEYMINSYFQKNIKGVVDSSYKYLKDKQAEEYSRNLEKLPVAPGMSGSSGMVYSSNAPQVARRYGTWSTKHTEDLVKMVHDKIYKNDTSFQHDIGILILEWQKLAKARLGDDEYNRLSKEVGCDLAASYISRRIDDLSVHRIAKFGAPKDTLDYIVTKGIEESFIGFVGGLSSSVPSSEYDNRVSNIQEERFGSGAKYAGRALGFGIDMVTPGVKMKGLWAGIDLTVRGVAYSRLDGNKKDYTSFEKDLGKAMFGNENALKTLRNSELGVNKNSDGVQILNSEMKKKVFVSAVDMNKVNVVYRSVEKSVNGDAEKLVNMVHDNLKSHKFKINESLKVAGWMYEKDDSWLIRNSAYYTAMALDMKSKGITTKKIGNKLWNVNEIAQRGYDYAVAVYQKQLVKVKNDVAKAENIVAKQSQGQPQQGQAYAQQATFVQTENGQLQIGNSMASQRQNVVASSGQTTSQPYSNGNNNRQSSQLGGWGQLFDTLGLSGFGDVGMNLGYVLSMLPDMLINMFTGKSRNLKFGDNLLPIGAIIMGMFTKNPLLKLLLIGLGGANLLNKAGHEVLDSRDGVKSKPSQQYRQYSDEVLDSRIKEPVMKGNTLLASIDGVPSVITINSADAVDAYYKGLLPLNTLANAVLRKYDEQQQAVQENYDRQVAGDETVELSRGLK